jgi:cell division protein FtsZ
MNNSTPKVGIFFKVGNDFLIDAVPPTAAKWAIERLEAQGIDISSAIGILTAVHGSGDISMNDFDAASRVFHEQISPNANVIIGVISDENLGGNVKVTILAVH